MVRGRKESFSNNNPSDGYTLRAQIDQAGNLISGRLSITGIRTSATYMYIDWAIAATSTRGSGAATIHVDKQKIGATLKGCPNSSSIQAGT